MARNRHGGDRTPTRPAAYSGVGKNSARTDGGGDQAAVDFKSSLAGDNLRHGDAQRLEEIRQATAVPDEAPVGAPQAPVPFQPVDLYAPTERPDEPASAGAALGPGAPDPNRATANFLRELYQRFGDDDIRDVLEELEGRFG